MQRDWMVVRMIPIDDSYAKLAFDAYSKAVGGKTFDGWPLPQWEDVGETVRAGWIAAANKVAETLWNESMDDMTFPEG